MMPEYPNIIRSKQSARKEITNDRQTVSAGVSAISKHKHTHSIFGVRKLPFHLSNE